MSQATEHSGTVTPTDDDAGAVRARVGELGLVAVAKLCGTGREPVARIAAGLPVRRGTLAIVRAALDLPLPEQPAA